MNINDMDQKNVTIIGIGLIGGSMAIALREKGISKKIIGIDSNKEHQEKALQLKLVDEIAEFDEAIVNSDLN